MSARWPLTLALASLEDEIWSTTPFAAVGLMVPSADDVVSFEFHTPVVSSVNRLHANEFQPGGAVDRSLAPWAVGALVRAPIDGGAMCFAALPDSRPFQDAETRALTRLTDQIAARSQEGEPAAARERRLIHVDALTDMLRTLGGALDLRDVFDQLSAIVRRVVPHDSAFVMIVSDDRSRVRLHALSVPKEWQVPEEVDNPYQHAMTDGWDFAVHHDLSADPVERDLHGSRAGLRSSIRLPLWLDGRVIGALIFSSFQPNQYRIADVPIARRIADY